MTLTYNQIIKISRAFQQAHHVLKNFGNGGEADMVLHNQQATYKYPLMWMVDNPSPQQDGMESFSFRVLFMAPVVTMPLDRGSDLMSTNVNEVKSDMIQCANHFIAYWVQQTDNYDTLGFDKVVNRDTFEDYTDDRLAGCSIDIRFYQPFEYDECGIPMGTPTALPDTCAPVLIYEDGILVDTVASGGTYSYSSGGGGTASQTFNGGAVTDQDSGTTKAITVKDSAGANIGTKGTDTALALNITVANATNSVNGVPIAGVKAEGDKTILVFNSEATNVGTVVTNSVDELEIEVPDATAVVKNSAGTTIHTELIPSGVSENIVITDSTAVVKNSEGTTLKTEAIPAEVSEDVTLNDITVVDSDGSSGSWPAGKNYTCTPSLNTSSLYKTGQTTSYATNDDGDLERGNGSNFTTLSHNNFFGNTNRFTDDLGGQTYASGWIIDWSTWNQITGDVIWWYNVLQTTGQTWSNLMALQPINIGGHADCYVPNENEMQSIVNREQTNGLNYSPLNFSVTTSAGRLWTSTTVPGTTANAFVFSGAVNSDLFISIAKTTTLRYILMRIGNTSEL